MTKIASHRGGTLEYGDSTPAGFIASAAMALEEVEFDVHPTKDNHIIVHHDATLDRTTDTHGEIVRRTLEEIKAARINYTPAAAPLTLEELCTIYRPSHVNFRCEIKAGVSGHPYENFVPKVLETLQKNVMIERTVFSSFNYQTLRVLTSLTDRPVLWLVSPMVLRQIGLEDVIALAKAINVPELALSAAIATLQDAEKIRSAGLDFGVWGAHDRETLMHAFHMQAKVLTTDRPSLAIACRTEWQSQGGAQ